MVSAQFYLMPGRYEWVHTGWHCANIKGYAELIKEKKHRVKTVSYDFPKLHHSNSNSFGVNATLSLKTVKVNKRSRDVTPRSKYKRSKWHPSPPVHQIWSNSGYYFQRYNGTCNFSLIGRHLESVGRTETVFELYLALSEERPTNECLSDSGIFFIELAC